VLVFPTPRCPIPHLHTLARCHYAISDICSALLGSVNGVLLVPSSAAVAMTIAINVTITNHDHNHDALLFPIHGTRVLTPPHSRAPTSGSWLVDSLDRVVGRTTPGKHCRCSAPHFASLSLHWDHHHGLVDGFGELS
jgi:hypothetical protein